MTSIVELVGGALDGHRFDHAANGVRSVPVGHTINVPAQGQYRVFKIQDGVVYARKLAEVSPS